MRFFSSHPLYLLFEKNRNKKKKNKRKYNSPYFSSTHSIPFVWRFDYFGKQKRVQNTNFDLTASDIHLNWMFFISFNFNPMKLHFFCTFLVQLMEKKKNVLFMETDCAEKRNLTTFNKLNFVFHCLLFFFFRLIVWDNTLLINIFSQI